MTVPVTIALDNPHRHDTAVVDALNRERMISVQVPAPRCARPWSRTYIHTGDRLASEPKPVVVDVALELDPVTGQSVGKTKFMPTDLMEQAAVEYADSQTIERTPTCGRCDRTTAYPEGCC